VPLLLSKRITPYACYAVWNIQETNAQLIALHNYNFPDGLHQTKLAEWLVTQILLNNVCQQFNIPFEGITKNEAGKPFLINNSAQISISHSFPMASVMINLNKSCGIDLERPRQALYKVQPKFLHKTENQFKDQLDKLCAIWCAKEVLFKIHGRKKLSLKDEMKVNFESSDRITGSILKDGFEQEVEIHFEPLKDYFLAYNI